REDPAQEISGERRMIEIAAVFVSPLQAMLVQNFSEAVKENGIVGADRVVGERELQRHRDKRERDDASLAQIATAGHARRFEQLQRLRGGIASRRSPSTTRLRMELSVPRLAKERSARAHCARGQKRRVVPSTRRCKQRCPGRRYCLAPAATCAADGLPAAT